MPHDQSNEIFIAIVAGTAIFLLFSTFCITYIILYWKRKVKHVQEVQKINSAFSEELLKSRLEIEEQTFAYISDEIHDSVGQSLSLANVQLSALEESNVFNKGLIRDAKTNINQSLAELRSMAHSLNGERVKTVNLSELIRDEAARFNRNGLYQVSVTQEGDTQSIPEGHRLMLFRLIQEGMQNIVKHAKASAIDITVKQTKNNCSIRLVDNGQGFTADAQSNQKTGMGLINMKKRTELMGGDFQIKSEPGIGTDLSITISYE
ncbi:MAG: sensor histidine kinase [Chitinophagaceae bacterium]